MLEKQTKNRKGSDTSEKIFDAAMKLLMSKGGGRLTLDAVAVQAGVSKSTLQYHYKTKEALLEEIVRRYLAYFSQRLRNGRIEAEILGMGSGNLNIAGYIEWYKRFSRENAFPPFFGIRIIAIAEEHPKLLALIQEWYSAQFQSLKSSDGSARNEAAFAAIEGLFFIKHFKLYDMDAQLEDKIIDVVRKLSIE